MSAAEGEADGHDQREFDRAARLQRGRQRARPRASTASRAHPCASPRRGVAARRPSRRPVAVRGEQQRPGRHQPRERRQPARVDHHQARLQAAQARAVEGAVEAHRLAAHVGGTGKPRWSRIVGPMSIAAIRPRSLVVCEVSVCPPGRARRRRSTAVRARAASGARWIDDEQLAGRTVCGQRAQVGVAGCAGGQVGDHQPVGALQRGDAREQRGRRCRARRRRSCPSGWPRAAPSTSLARSAGVCAAAGDCSTPAGRASSSCGASSRVCAPRPTGRPVRGLAVRV